MTLLRRAALARGALMAALLAGFVWGVSYTVLLTRCATFDLLIDNQTIKL
jgi:hypothetical protein